MIPLANLLPLPLALLCNHLGGAAGGHPADQATGRFPAFRRAL
jgi:hypothetical protein